MRVFDDNSPLSHRDINSNHLLRSGSGSGSVANVQDDRSIGTLGSYSSFNELVEAAGMIIDRETTTNTTTGQFDDLSPFDMELDSPTFNLYKSHWLLITSSSDWLEKKRK